MIRFSVLKTIIPHNICFSTSRQIGTLCLMLLSESVAEQTYNEPTYENKKLAKGTREDII